ncbi:F0F1 ATP synthase subunit delta [Microbacterium sp. GXF7504]
MGSATTHALAGAHAALARTTGIDLGVTGELFEAARALGDNSHLRSALADSAATPEARRGVVNAVFGASVSPATLSLLGVVVDQRWSSATDLVDGIEELAVRAASVAAPQTDLEQEIFQVAGIVTANPDLELALGSRIGDPASKGALVSSILGGRVSEATALVVTSLVRNTRGRRLRQLLSDAMDVVADQRGRTVATVTAAAPLSDAQAQRLSAALTERYGKPVTLNTVVDPTIVGGVRVQVADDLIDASISTRIADLRQRLAG